MRSLLHAFSLALCASSAAAVVDTESSQQPPSRQYPLVFPVPSRGNSPVEVSDGRPPQRKLHGRFLWLTDIHPDPFYKVYASTEEEGQCHRGRGASGYYGAETSSCDTPLSLVNATFDWIEEHLADKVDFVIWTGDSARHDNDDGLPRSDEQIKTLNRMVADKMLHAFGRNDDGDQTPKVVPTLGNNDILPHNIFQPGPNHWTSTYLNIWEPFIPEEQRHTFSMGGFFFVEAIPNRLAVFSLNTLYFFAKNAAVDGCLDPTEPGAHQFKWLRVQLQRMRERGMKVILMGHVPPARTGKQLWDETCWQMYTLFTHQFRDIIVGSLYGHMDLDHFFLQDFNDFDYLQSDYESADAEELASTTDFTIAGAKDYILDLGREWAALPKLPAVKQASSDNDLDAEKKKKKGNKGHKGKKGGKKRHDVGGPWAESYSLTIVSPSIIPSFFPTLRIFEYNITDAYKPPMAPLSAFSPRIRDQEEDDEVVRQFAEYVKNTEDDAETDAKAKDPKFIVPKGPSKSSPPGPAYSPQTFTWHSYKQYYANLTVINNDFADEDEASVLGGWDGGKHKDKKPKKKKPHPKEFKFEVEYDTAKDKIYKLKDMTVRSYLDLARRLGKGAQGVDGSKLRHNDADVDKKKKRKKKHRKDKKQRKHNDLWLTFLRRAFVGTKHDDELSDKFTLRDQDALNDGVSYEL